MQGGGGICTFFMLCKFPANMMKMGTVAGFKCLDSYVPGYQNVNILWKAASGKGFNVKKFFQSIWKCDKGEYICSILKNYLLTTKKTKQYEQS